MFALIAILAALIVPAIADDTQSIGSWQFSSGKIGLALDGQPAAIGSMISASSGNDSDADFALLQIVCVDKQYRLDVVYGADSAPLANDHPRIHIDIDNNYWIEGDTKMSVNKSDDHSFAIDLASDIGPKNLGIVARARTALKITTPGGRQLRFLVNGTRDAFIALHDAC